MEQVTNNKVSVAGVVEKNPTLSHEVLGEKFYETNLIVKRLSGFCDSIPLTMSEKLLSEHPLVMGQNLAVVGQFRSYNKQLQEKSKLMLTVFVREIVPFFEVTNPNFLEICGYICKEPVFRTTPFKREICDVLIAVNRGYNKSDYLPCIAWGRNAKLVKDFSVGDKVSLEGRIQSRTYEKKVSETETVQKIAYEISVSKIERALVKQEETMLLQSNELSQA